MFRIAVISDTHIPGKARQLPYTVLKGIEGVDMIIHAGDINEQSVIRSLGEIAPVEAVAGNTDSLQLWEELGRRKVICAGGVRIGIVHGDGKSGTTLERAASAFKGEGLDCIVFGHSHIPLCQESPGVLYFNPGSPTDRRRQKSYSYGLLEIDAGISAKVIYF